MESFVGPRILGSREIRESLPHPPPTGGIGCKGV
jgi:hypothetical protein